MSELAFLLDEIDLNISLLLAATPSSVGYPSEDEGGLTTLSWYYRLRGIGRYLYSGDILQYQRDLERSAGARLYYLRGVVGGRTGAIAYARTSRNRGFFDALAVNALEWADELAELGGERIATDLEYEDTFLDVQSRISLYLALRNRRPRTEAEEWLERFRRSAEDARVGMVAAIHKGDGAALDAELREQMEVVGRNFKRALKTRSLAPILLHTERFIDVKAVATLRIASLAGVSIGMVIPRVPDELVALAHRPRTTPPDPNAWRQP